MNLIKVMDQEIVPVLYRGTPVLALRQVDELHQRPSGTTRACFNRHKEELVEGEDYFTLSYDEWSKLSIFDRTPNVRSKGGRRDSMTFLTESGYLLVTKPFTDKRSWQVQRVLVRSYFMVRRAMVEEVAPPPRLIEIDPLDLVELYKAKAELAELKLKVATGDTEPRRRNASPDEEARIIALRRQGYGPTAIGEKVGRTASGIDAILGRLKRQKKI